LVTADDRERRLKLLVFGGVVVALLVMAGVFVVVGKLAS
jgi:hypothetical protein